MTVDWTQYKFFSSLYFVPEPDNWHIKDDAPEEIKKEFEEAMKLFDFPHEEQERKRDKGWSV
jgi:small-conductance mechanosensitive channel